MKPSKREQNKQVNNKENLLQSSLSSNNNELSPQKDGIRYDYNDSSDFNDDRMS